MDRFFIEPEVSGELGHETDMDTSVHPPIITSLHFIFTGWLGDDIIECFPIYLVTENLGKSLKDNNIKGFELKSIKVEKSRTFTDLQPDISLPKFYWLDIDTSGSEGDFKIKDNILTVSNKVLNILKRFNIEYLDIQKV